MRKAIEWGFEVLLGAATVLTVGCIVWSILTY